jgi:uncharacterized membrane protein YczE
VFQSNLASKLPKLFLGLLVYRIGIALTVDAQIGIAPWDVLAQGISRQLGISFGVATVAVSVLVLMLWIPLRVKQGLASILNALLIGLFADLALGFMQTPQDYLSKLAMFIIGMFVISFATGMYISVVMGKGPRDGLSIGLAKKLDRPFWQARLVVELSVVSLGFLLGGQAREGTLLFAFGIGYLNQLGLRLFKLADKYGRV